MLTAVVLTCGTFGYLTIEDGWSPFDAFYMTVITLTTIGFGEVHTLSPAGRAFTMLLVLFGLGAAAAFASQLGRIMLDGNLGEYWRRHRMERRIARIEKHVIVCGYGRIGRSICHELATMDGTCVVIEADPERQTEAQNDGFAVLSGNATCDLALIGAGIGRASAIVAALSQDTDNVFVALTARDLNPEIVIIARAEDPTHESRMIKAGVNRVVYPAQLGGGRIALMVGEEMGLDVEEAEVRELEAVVLLMDKRSDRRHVPTTHHLPARDEAYLATGIPEIDDEHQRIMTLVGRLHRAEGPRASQIVKEVLDDLMAYTTYHFRSEESLFLGTDYPDADSHIAEHESLTEKVRALAASSDNVHPASLAVLLEGWLAHHIREVNRGIVPYLGTTTVGAGSRERS